MNCKSVNALAREFLVQAHRKKRVGGFGLGVSVPLVIRSQAVIHVVPVDVRTQMGGRAERHHSSGSRVFEDWKQQIGQQKMTQMVGAKLGFKAVWCVIVRRSHDSSVVNQGVQARVLT